MHILEYCESSGEPVARLAKRMGLDRSHLNKIALGQRDASADLLRRLYAATKGKITPTDQVFAPRIEPGRRLRRAAKGAHVACLTAKAADRSANGAPRESNPRSITNKCKDAQKVRQSVKDGRKARGAGRGPL